MQEAVLQLIKFHANFTRKTTIDDVMVELAGNFIKLTPHPEPVKKSPRRPEEDIDSAIENSIHALR